MKKPNLTLSLAEAVRIIDQASADSTPQLAIAVAATVLADFARQSLEPQPPVTTGNVVFTEIDHHKRTAVAVPVSQADLQKWQDIITLLTNDISLLLHTSALQMARHIDSLQIRLAEAERVLRGIDAACLKVCVDSTGTADDFGKESADWRYLLIGEGDAEIIATDDPASVIESLGQMLGARDFALGQQWVTKMTTADVDSPSVLGAGLLAELERVTMEQVERACVAFYGERGWNTAPVRMKADACEWMRAALTAARGGG